MSYTIYTDPPQSRNEAIVKATIDSTQYTDPPQSRMEDLLIELKATIEGGGGGGTTNYNNLENRPQINNHTLEGDMSFAELGIDTAPTEDSTNAVASGGVYAGLADKIDKSSTGYQTITGTPLEFDSPSPQMVNMKCDIVASQDLHGYDKPWAGGEGKNKLPLVLSDIKSWNTDGTWNDNKYTIRNCEIEFDTNGDFVTSIRFKNTSNEQFNLYLYQGALPEGSYILNGCPANGSLSTYWQSMVYGYDDVGNGVSFTSDGQTNFNLQIVVRVNINMDNKIFYPMARLATETDPTYEPYSNICPISGTDTIDIDVGGKNRVIPTANPFGINGGTGVTNYEATSHAYIAKGLAGETVTVSRANHTSSGYFWYGAYAETELEGGLTPLDFGDMGDNLSATISVPIGTGMLVIFTGADEPIDLQVEIGSTATEYEPYIVGESYTIDLDGTRYGGTLDVTSGVLTLTHGEIVIDEVSTQEWLSSNVYQFEFPTNFEPQNVDNEVPTGLMCNLTEISSITLVVFNGRHGLTCSKASGSFYINIGISDLTDMNAYLAENPLQVVYELATPQTIQLTPTQVWAVQGGNTITVSVDGVEAEVHSSNYATLRDINDLWDYIKQSPQGSSDGVRFGASNLEMIGGTMS